MHAVGSERKLPIEQLIADERCQARAEQRTDVVAEYAEAMRAGVAFPPIDVFMVDGAPWVTDGMHRLAAHVEAGISFVRTRVVGSGTVAEAIYQALASNAKHGLRRTNADKRRAVMLALENEIGVEQSSRTLATHLGVSNDFISRLRAEWEMSRQARDVSSNDTSPQKRRDSAGRMQPAKRPRPTPNARPYPEESDDLLPHEIPTTPTVCPTCGQRRTACPA